MKSNSPAFTPATKAAHSSSVNASACRVRSLVSRTRTAPSSVRPTSSARLPKLQVAALDAEIDHGGAFPGGAKWAALFPTASLERTRIEGAGECVVEDVPGTDPRVGRGLQERLPCMALDVDEVGAYRSSGISSSMKRAMWARRTPAVNGSTRTTTCACCMRSRR